MFVIPHTHTICNQGIDKVIRTAWAIVGNAKNEYQKIHALNLIHQCYITKQNLAGDATVINAALEMIKKSKAELNNLKQEDFVTASEAAASLTANLQALEKGKRRPSLPLTTTNNQLDTSGLSFAESDGSALEEGAIVIGASQPASDSDSDAYTSADNPQSALSDSDSDSNDTMTPNQASQGQGSTPCEADHDHEAEGKAENNLDHEADDLDPDQPNEGMGIEKAAGNPTSTFGHEDQQPTSPSPNAESFDIVAIPHAELGDGNMDGGQAINATADAASDADSLTPSHNSPVVPSSHEVSGSKQESNKKNESQSNDASVGQSNNDVDSDADLTSNVESEK